MPEKPEIDDILFIWYHDNNGLGDLELIFLHHLSGGCCWSNAQVLGEQVENKTAGDPPG